MAKLKLFFIFTLFTLAFSLYQEQAGRVDWFDAHLGQIHSVIVPKSDSALRNLVFVTSKEGTVAALHAASGDIAWRQVLPEGEGIQNVAFQDHALVVLSQGGRMLRNFDPQTGSLMWEERILPSMPSKPYRTQLGVSSTTVATLAAGRVELRSVRSGKTIWTYSKPGEAGIALLPTKEHTLPFILLTAHPELIRIDTTSGAKKTGTTIQLPDKVSITDLKFVQSAFTAARLVVLRQSDGAVFSGSGEPEQVFRKMHLQGEKVRSIEHVTMFAGSLFGVYTLEDGRLLAVRWNIASNAETVVALAPAGSIASNLIVVEKGAFLAVVTPKGSDAVHVEIHDVGKVAAVASFDHPFSFANRGSPASVTLAVNEDGSNPRVFVVSQDRSLSLLLSPSAVANRGEWAREEALAGVSQALFFDLPPPKRAHGAEFEEEPSVFSVITAFVNRITGQIEDLAEFAQSLSQRIPALLSHSATATSTTAVGASKMEHDRNGFNKIIVVATEAGKIFALHTERGQIVWSLNYLQIVPSASAGAARVQIRLLPSRTHPGTRHTAAAIISIQGEGHFAAEIDVVSGRVLSTQSLRTGEADIVHVSMLPVVNAHTHTHPVFIVDAKNKVHLFPDTEDSRSLLSTLVSTLHFQVADRARGTLSGYGLSIFPAQVEELWTMALAEGERMEAVHVHSGTAAQPHSANLLHITPGVGAALFKYLNPSLITMAVASPASGDSKSEVLHMYLIDGVTGRVVERMAHEGASGPVSIAQNGNWIVYTYMSTRPRRTEMTVLELFRQPPADVKLLQGNVPVNFSSHEDVQPVVLHHTYALPATVRTLSVTRTAQSITANQLLVGLGTNQVLGLDRRFVDALRPDPASITNSQKEEGVVPFHPVMPIVQTAIISYNKTIHGLRGIESSPCVVESTSHVFAYGRDLFYSRVAPSKTYDLLNEDFNHLLLMAVTLGLAVAAYVGKVMTARKDLRRVWK